MRSVVPFLTGLGVLPWIAYVVAFPVAIDAHAYFLGQYSGVIGQDDALLYSPAFSQFVEPLRWLGWDAFRTIWRGMEVAVLTALTGPFVGPLLFVHPVALEVNMGNIHLLMAGVITAGFRWPALWSFVLLTKVTPGVGLVWFAVRREWRKLGIALGVTAAIAAVSVVLAPGPWFEWFGVLGRSEAPPVDTILTAPLTIRIAAAAALVAWGARKDYRWTVLVGAFIALPSVWYFGLAMAVALPRLVVVRDDARTAAVVRADRAVEAAPAAVMNPPAGHVL